MTFCEREYLPAICLPGGGGDMAGVGEGEVSLGQQIDNAYRAGVELMATNLELAMQLKAEGVSVEEVLAFLREANSQVVEIFERKPDVPLDKDKDSAAQ